MVKEDYVSDHVGISVSSEILLICVCIFSDGYFSVTGCELQCHESVYELHFLWDWSTYRFPSKQTL